MEKDLLGGPTDPSPHVGGASLPQAPNDWGINGHPPYSTTPCGSNNHIRLIPEGVALPKVNVDMQPLRGILLMS